MKHHSNLILGAITIDTSMDKETNFFHQCISDGRQRYKGGLHKVNKQPVTYCFGDKDKVLLELSMPELEILLNRMKEFDDSVNTLLKEEENPLINYADTFKEEKILK